MDVVQDRLDAFLSALLNRSDSSGPEEHLGRKYFILWLYPLALKDADLGVTEPPLVVHRLDGVEYNLGGSLQVGQGSVDLLGLDDDEPVDKVRIHRPER